MGGRPGTAWNHLETSPGCESQSTLDSERGKTPATVTPRPKRAMSKRAFARTTRSPAPPGTLAGEARGRSQEGGAPPIPLS